MKQSAFIVAVVSLLWQPAFAQTGPGAIVPSMTPPQLQAGTKPLSETAQLKARIVQLESQLTEAVRRINLLTAQLSEAQQPLIAQDQQKKRAEAEKEAGCPLNWNASPPVCKPEKDAKK